MLWCSAPEVTQYYLFPLPPQMTSPKCDPTQLLKCHLELILALFLQSLFQPINVLLYLSSASLWNKLEGFCWKKKSFVLISYFLFFEKAVSFFILMEKLKLWMLEIGLGKTHQTKRRRRREIERRCWVFKISFWFSPPTTYSQKTLNTRRPRLASLLTLIRWEDLMKCHWKRSWLEIL